MSDSEYPNENIGKRFGDFVIEDVIMQKQSGLPSKVICLHKVKWDDGRIELRLGYYRKNGDKWVWGRNATFAPPEDLRAIVDKAMAKGWI